MSPIKYYNLIQLTTNCINKKEMGKARNKSSIFLPLLFLGGRGGGAGGEGVDFTPVETVSIGFYHWFLLCFLLNRKVELGNTFGNPPHSIFNSPTL